MSHVPTVLTAYCTCPAGLAASCNHIAGLLYALEDFVRLGLREEAAKTCTEKRMQWIHPRAAHVKASRVTEVHVKKDTYSGRDLGEKKKSIPFYDPMPTNRRFVNPEAVARLRNDLERVQEKALAEDKSGKIKMYGSSCWLKLLEPSPVPSSDDSECDEGSSSESDNERQMGVLESSCEAPVPMVAIDPESPADFYKHRVAVSSARAAEIARETKGQSANLSWYNER